MRAVISTVAGLAAFAIAGHATAQSNFVTYESNAAVSAGDGSGRVERVYSAPSYQPYDAGTFDEGAYKTATEPMPMAVPQVAPLQAVPEIVDGGGRPYGQPVDVTPTDSGETYRQPVAYSSAPSLSAPIGDADLEFREESETSRLLLALDDTFAERQKTLAAQKLTQRKALLDQFEQDAADPSKVIGLAERMRAAMAELDAAHEAKLALERQQYNAAVLTVLDRAPSRVE